MRKFIVSDIHGNGDIYDSIMGYLETVGLNEEVHLYINGDLIDRGLDSFRVLMDVKERMEGKGTIKVHYLGGNHELMMYHALRKRKPGKTVNHWCDWIRNGGGIIEGELDSREDGEKLSDSLRDFMGELKIYHLFDEKIQDSRMLLVHAQAPKRVGDLYEMKIKDDNHLIEKAVWTRKDKSDLLWYGIESVFGLNRIGLDGYFTIKGHTPVTSQKGFEIDTRENYINIDGGCAGYAYGHFEYNHVPLLEVKEGFLRILVFNHNNEINAGYYYDGKLSKMSDEELTHHRGKLDIQYDGQAEKYKKLILESINNK